MNNKAMDCARFAGSGRWLTVFLAACVGLTACGGGSGGGNGESPEPSQNAGLLKPVADEQELMAAMQSAYTQRTSQQEFTATGPELAAAPDNSLDDGAAGEGDSGSFTGTYTVELDVDELDVVKYDGDHLYIVPTLQNRCCFAFPADGGVTSDADILPPQQPAGDAAIRILATNSSNATASEAGEIPLNDGEFVQGLYLLDGQLITLSTTEFYGTYGGPWLDVAYWAEQRVDIRGYDNSDVSAVSQQWEVSVEGGFVDTRRVGDTVYLISRHTPDIDVHYYPDDEGKVAENRAKFDSLSAEDITPTLTVNGTERPLFAPADCYTTNPDADQSDAPGYPVLTSITAISLSDPTNPQTTCYNEQAAGVYMSSNAVYLTDVRYNNGSGDVTRVHKFAIGNGKPQYRGSAEVDGYVWTGGQRDFRLSEYNDQLRLVTTLFRDDEQDRQDHRVYILGEASEGLALETIASLPNNSRPAEIGKPNEALYGVRFFGERAYLVTFEQIDPLYVLDLSDPSDPYIAGELEVTGFSDFLHPVNDDLLLGLGVDNTASNRVKLELFDVSDIAAPASLGSILIGEEGQHSWSEAQYDRHAFSYLADAENGVDRFAVPAQLSGESPEGGYFNEESLYLFEVRGKDQAASASLFEQGRILASPKPEDYGYGYRHRSVIHDDAVFFISGDYVWSALWQDPENRTGPQ